MYSAGPEVAPELICNSSPLERVPSLRTNNSDDGRVPVISKNPLGKLHASLHYSEFVQIISPVMMTTLQSG